MAHSPGEERAARTRYTLALAFSLAILLAGMVWTWKIGQQSNRLAHQLSHAREGLDGLRRVLSKQEART